MKRFPQLSMLFLATAMAAGSAIAAEAPAPAPKVVSENSQAAKVNLVHLSTKADQVLSNDTMMVRLFAEHDSKTSQEAFDRTTQAMERLFELQRTEAGKAKLRKHLV
jgi:predicted secreted protein